MYLEYLFLVAALLGSVSCKLTFEPSKLNLADIDSKGVEVKVSLSKDMKSSDGDVVVGFDTGASISSDMCRLTFSKYASFAPQTVKFFPVSTGNDKRETKEVIKAFVYSEAGAKCNVYEDKIAVTRKNHAVQMCHAHGDPHVKTFDKAIFSVFCSTNITYDMVKSDDLNIQVRLIDAPDQRFAIGDVAISYKDSLMIAYINDKGPKGSDPVQSITFNPGQNGNMVHEKGSNKNRKAVEVALSDGTRIQLGYTFYDPANHYFTNVKISLPRTYQNKTTGICGNYNGKAEDDMLGEMACPATSSQNDLFITKRPPPPSPNGTHPVNVGRCYANNQTLPAICGATGNTKVNQATQICKRREAPVPECADKKIDKSECVKVLSTYLDKDEAKLAELMCKTDVAKHANKTESICGFISDFQTIAEDKCTREIVQCGEKGTNATQCASVQTFLEKFHLSVVKKEEQIEVSLNGHAVPALSTQKLCKVHKQKRCGCSSRTPRFGAKASASAKATSAANVK